MKQLSERVARVEHSQAKLELGLLEGLREAITVRAAASEVAVVRPRKTP